VKFEFVDAEKATFKVALACRMLGVSRSGFYAWRGRPESAHARRDRLLAVKVRESFDKSRKTYGSPRIQKDLEAQGEHISRKRVIRLMQEQEIVARKRRRFKNTTDSNHDQPVAPNLLERQFEAERPNRRWVGDTTELRVGQGGRLFLAVILDLFARFVVGWALSAVNDRHLTIKALRMALRRRCPDSRLLHHSDRGSTYAAEDYQKELAARGITCSMSRRGNCLDNAAMESWNSTFKAECGEDYESYAEANEKAFDYIEAFYNVQRRHSTLGYLTPAEFERQHRETADLKAA
jgi:transposase InsO family protein